MTDSRPQFSAAFNRVVRRHRLARNFSQELLSERASVDRTYVGLLERGHRSPGLEVAKRLADALDLSLAQLVEEAEVEWQARQPASHREVPQPTVAEGKKRSQRAKRAVPTDRRNR